MNQCDSSIDNLTWDDALERLETKAANHKAAILLLLDEANDIRNGITAICEVFQEHTGELRGHIPRRLRDALLYERKSVGESIPCSKVRSHDHQYPLVESQKRQGSCRITDAMLERLEGEQYYYLQLSWR